MTNTRLNGIDPFIRLLDHHVSRVVNNVGIVACTAGHCVGPFGTVNQVAAAIAYNGVVQGITSTIDVSRTGQFQVLNIVGQSIIDVRPDSISSLALKLGDLVTDIVHHIGVITEATHHGVCAYATVKQVIASVAGESIILRIAGAG